MNYREEIMRIVKELDMNKKMAILSFALKEAQAGRNQAPCEPLPVKAD